MDVQEAIATAKNFVRDLFKDEDPRNIGLEELQFDEEDEVWDVTVGFSRPWDEPRLGALAEMLTESKASPRPALRRTYKVVSLAKRDGRLIAIRNRDI